MSQDNSTVRFVEDKGKWMWKRYDANGSVIGRSELFDTERGAREDYEAKGGVLPEVSEPSNAPVEAQTEPTAPEAPVNDVPADRGAIDEGQQPAETQPEQENTTATLDENADVSQSEDNTAGTTENAPVEGSASL
jgi:hypothetical protein